MAGRKQIDMTGCHYGKLIVLELFDVHKHGRRWHCQCACGKETIVFGHLLRSGNTTSCGCMASNAFKHGCAKHKGRIYNVWRRIKIMHRTKNIKLCAKWETDYSQFEKDVGQRPSEKHTFKCINLRRGYVPDNVEWRLSKQKSVKHHKTISYRGYDFSLSKWARILDYSRHTLGSRLCAGWSIEKAFQTIPRKYERHNR